MISTDACGQGSCLYGKTSNHALALRVVLMDGSDFWSRPLSNKELADYLVREDRIGDIYRTVERIMRENRERIDAVFPNLNRYMTGYDLAHVERDDGMFDLNAILCGSEGTLALIAEAELNLLPIPAETALINIRYSDFNAALEDARNLTALKVASVETVDEKVLGLAKSDIVWTAISRFFSEDDGRPQNGVNIVEVLADNAAEIERKLAHIVAALDHAHNGSRLGHTIARGHKDTEAIWTMRKRAVGLLGNVDGVSFVRSSTASVCLMACSAMSMPAFSMCGRHSISFVRIMFGWSGRSAMPWSRSRANMAESYGASMGRACVRNMCRNFLATFILVCRTSSAPLTLTIASTPAKLHAAMTSRC